MPKKKRTTTRARSSSVRVKGRSASSVRRSKSAGRPFSRLLLPLVIIALLVGFIALFVHFGYQTATASEFFNLRNVDVRGVDRTQVEDIKRIVDASAEKSGVWNADLSDIRSKIEKYPFVKSAAVSKILPGGIRVNVIERVPAAVVHLSAGNYLVDVEGTILTVAGQDEKAFPVILYGWDEAKTEKAIPDNLARLKMYRKMLDEWKPFDLAARVKHVNLANTREPIAVVTDSGREIAVSLAKDNLGKSLKMAIEAVTGKGAKIKSVDAEGISPVIQFIEF